MPATHTHIVTNFSRIPASDSIAKEFEAKAKKDATDRATGEVDIYRAWRLFTLRLIGKGLGQHIPGTVGSRYRVQRPRKPRFEFPGVPFEFLDRRAVAAMAKAYGLPGSGSKIELVERLIEANVMETPEGMPQLQDA